MVSAYHVIDQAGVHRFITTNNGFIEYIGGSRQLFVEKGKTPQQRIREFGRCFLRSCSHSLRLDTQDLRQTAESMVSAAVSPEKKEKHGKKKEDRFIGAL